MGNSDRISEFSELPKKHPLCEEAVWQPENNDFLPEDNGETLGLHRNRCGKLCASHFVGQVQIDSGDGKKHELRVHSKIDNVNFLGMFQKCLFDPVVSAQLDRCFYFWPEKAPLKTPMAENQVRELIITLYLKELFQLCKRHLRKEFFQVENNLVGRVKGKILVHQNIRSNSARGRLDRVACLYQSHDFDCPENQILRAALQQSIRTLRRSEFSSDGTKVNEWARFCDAALAGVKIKRIHPSIFCRLRLGVLKKVYKKPINLAKWVLSLLGSDPNSESQKSEIPPYAIDMNELFERYCEALLREKGASDLWAGYQNRNIGHEFKIRPDFILPSEKTVLDAKYKDQWDDRVKFDKDHWKNVRSDVYQLVTYACHQAALDKSGNPENKLKVCVLYPSMNEGKIGLGEEEEVLRNDFQNPRFCVRKVFLPRSI